MRIPITLLLVALLSVSVAVGQDNSGNTPEPAIWAAPDQTLEELHQLIEDIEVANRNRIFSVEMVFDEPVTLKEIREAAIYFEIPRVLAEIGSNTTVAGYGTVAFGLGTIYENANAWQREICRMRTYTNPMLQLMLATAPPEDWSVTEMHVYGTAHAITELRRGTVLPPAQLTEGGAEGHSRGAEGLIAYETQQIAKMIDVPPDYIPPSECLQYVKALDAPILSGRTLHRSPAEAGKGPAELLRQQLSDRAADVAVTLNLEFNQELNIEAFAAFVERHQIDGLSADLSPISHDRIAITALLSIYGEPLEEKVIKTRCMIEMNKHRLPNPSDDWLGSRARISVPVHKVWQITEDPTVNSARLESEFAPEKISLVENFYRQKAAEVLRLPPSMKIPNWCEKYFQHTE